MKTNRSAAPHVLTVIPFALMGDIDFSKVKLFGTEDAAGAHVRLSDVPIFRAGDYKDRGVFSVEDVKELARVYDTSWSEAPVTVDHVTTGPAMGWIKALREESGWLYSDWQVPAEVFAMIRRGDYKKRSIEIRKDVERADGSKGLYVRAVSLLGVMSPVIKGMPDIKFSETESHVAVDFAEETEPQHEEPPTNLGSNGSENHSKENSTTMPGDPKTVTLSEEDHKALIDRLAKAESTASKTGTDFSELSSRLDAAESANVKLAKDNEALRARFNKRDSEAKFAEAMTKCKGRLAKPEADAAKALYFALSETESSAEVTFGEGDQATKHGIADAFLAFLEMRPKIVPVDGKAKVFGMTPDDTDEEELESGAPNSAGAFNGNYAEWDRAVTAKAKELRTATPTLGFAESVKQAAGIVGNAPAK